MHFDSLSGSSRDKELNQKTTTKKYGGNQKHVGNKFQSFLWAQLIFQHIVVGKRISLSRSLLGKPMECLICDYVEFSLRLPSLVVAYVAS